MTTLLLAMLAATPLTATEETLARQSVEGALLLEFGLRESDVRVVGMRGDQLAVALTTSTATRVASDLLGLVEEVRQREGALKAAHDQPTLDDAFRRLLSSFDFEPTKGWPQPAKRPPERLAAPFLMAVLVLYAPLLDAEQCSSHASDELISRAAALAKAAQLSLVGEALEATFKEGHAPLRLLRPEGRWTVELPPGWTKGTGLAPKLAVRVMLEWEGKWPDRAGESADLRAARIAWSIAQRAQWAFTLGAPKYFSELPDVLTDDATALAAGEIALLLTGATFGKDKVESERVKRELDEINARRKSGRELLRDYTEAYRHHLEHVPDKQVAFAGNAASAELLGLQAALAAKVTSLGPDRMLVEAPAKTPFGTQEAIRERGAWRIRNVPKGAAAPTPAPVTPVAPEPEKTVFMYEDAKGEQHFVDDLSKVPERYRARAKPFH